MEHAVNSPRDPFAPSRPGPAVAPPASASRLETRDGAYELKFLLPDSLVEEVAAWARRHLPADPHAAGSQDETYGIHSVYFDTPDLAVYHRRPGFRTRKYRVRRYGGEETYYLEEKRKRRGWVTKVRTRIPDAELALLEAGGTGGDWAGAWFAEALRRRLLVPTCQVAYRRLAREGRSGSSPVRLTIDREIVCSRAPGLRPGWAGEPQVRVPLTVLELKYRDHLPAVFKELILSFGLSAAPASKYRRAAEACLLGRGE